MWHHHGRALILPSVKVINSSVTWHNKHLSHTKLLSQVLDFFLYIYCLPPLPNPRMSRSQESLNDVAFECRNLQSGATSCTGQPYWRLQTHRGMNSNRLCVRWWQREASQKTASPRSFHLCDISKSPTSQKFSFAKITGEERTLSETAHYRATTLCICTYIGRTARVHPACFSSIYRI